MHRAHAHSYFILNAVASAVGYQATTGDGKTEKPSAVLEALIGVVRPTGGLGVPGLYVPSDPGAPDSAAAQYVAIPTCAEWMLIKVEGVIYHSPSVSY